MFVCAGILACGLSWFAIPPIIRVARIKKLYDEPFEVRKVHKRRTPSLGGLAIFTAFLISCGLCLTYQTMPYANYLLAAGVIIFTIGLKDDLVGMDPYKKFAAQILASWIIVYLADIRITSLYGVFNIYDIPVVMSYAVSILFIVFVINAFNLIDGIDGLAGSIGLTVCATYGVFFYSAGESGLAIISFALAGALLGFLRFNFSPARLFMGDSGSYTSGFVIALLTLRFIELNKFNMINNPDPFVRSAPAVALGILIIPLFDTIRVFFIRIAKKRSPFTADRNHLHHRLIRIGFSHTRATLILTGVNLLFIVLVFRFQNIGAVALISLVLSLALAINLVLWLYDIHLTRMEKRRLATATDEIRSLPATEYEQPGKKKPFVEELLSN